MEQEIIDLSNNFFDVLQKENIYIDFDKIENKTIDEKNKVTDNFLIKKKLERENEKKVIQLLNGFKLN